MKFAIVVFPGSNCDHDCYYAVQSVIGKPVEFIWHQASSLKGFDAVILPGGFSYGDYLRCGALARFSPVMASIRNFAAEGKFVFGICNGFQILCEAGLLAGALLHNDSRKFICKNIFLKAENASTKITSKVPANKALKIPIAHGEGKYFADQETLKKMNENGQILFRYCDEAGKITESANPNGATDNIAGVSNAGKNVFGMMPHPERAADKELFNEDGRWIFESILAN